MTDYRLTHGTRGTLEFRQAQRDEDTQQAVSDVTAEIGVDRPALVHTRSRERERALTGRVTAPRRAANDADTSDWQQALANYVLELEAHVDEFQGTGYTFEDDRRDESLSAVLRGVEWTIRPGQPYEVEYEIDLHVGRGTFDSRSVSPETATVNTGMDVVATIDGHELPGLRDMRVEKFLEFEVNAIYNKDSAEDTELVVDTGVQHRFEIAGTHTGTRAEREAADKALDAVIGDDEIDLVTRFPGYTKTGSVTQYRPERNAGYGSGRHDYTLTFIEATEA